MAGLTPLPQTVLHSSTRLTHRQAHDLLSSFLEEAQNNAAYRPDAILTQHGPQASSVGEGSNLTLNHLDRILKGIAGQRVGGIEFNYGQGPPKRRKVDSEVAFNSSPPITKHSSYRQQDEEQEEVVEMEGANGEEDTAVVAAETGGWQDKEDYEHAQIDETEDLDGRDPAEPAVRNGDDGDGIEVRADDLDGIRGGEELTKGDKEARKLAKKLRRKKEKQQKGS